MDMTSISSPALTAANAKKAESDLSRALSGVSAGSGSGAGKALTPETLKRIDTAALDFEAMFLSEMLKPMFEGIEVNSEFGGGKGEEVFRGFMIQEYGKAFAARGGIGIAEKVREHMIRLQTGTLDQPIPAPSVAASAAYLKSAELDAH